jgi:ABC-type bacteriocin/lantibiotic exporter with double-glycine peptidase domain
VEQVDGVEAGRPPHVRRKLTIALKLLSGQKRFLFALLIAARMMVGLCDLLVAAEMYFLFLLLQGRAPAHHFWWIPSTSVSAASITAVLVIIRALADLSISRFIFHQIQHLYTYFLLRLTQGYSEMQWSRFVEYNRSELSNHALTTASDAAEFYYRWIEMTAAVGIVVVMAVAVVYKSPVAACWFGIALAASYGLHQFLIRSRLQAAASSREDSLKMLRRNLADMFSSGKEIRTYGNRAFFQDRIQRAARRIAASNVRVVFLPHIARTIADQGAVLVLLTVIIVVQLRNGDTGQLLSLLAFYFVLSRRLLPLISQISFIAGQMEGSYENVRVVDFELTECSRFRMAEVPAPLPQDGLVLELSKISFSFHESSLILEDVNLRVRKDEIIVLHGASGIGKSSLLNLIAGVTQPRTGVVYVDRANIAYVPQEVPLLDDSIRNNLLFGLTDRSDKDLANALRVANLAEFVSGQSRGMETRVGDDGVLFSGGQRQRLGLARAIVRGGHLLLLDEATSALDEENERRILENLSASGRAVLLVTHRVRSRLFAHRVFRFQGGRLIEHVTDPNLKNPRQLSVTAVPLTG